MDKDDNLSIAIILDGNRRYAKKQGLKPWQGHNFGAEKVKNLLEWCQELEVKELTLYSFSMDNFQRPEKEKKVLFLGLQMIILLLGVLVKNSKKMGLHWP